MDMNHVGLIGRLTRSAELKYLNSGTAVSNFSIAINKVHKNDKGERIEQVSYFDIVLYGKPAINLQQYLLRGKQVGIEGELRQDRWTKDNQSFSRVYIVASNVMLLGGNSNSQPHQEQLPPAQNQLPPTPIQDDIIDVFTPDFIDDVKIF